MSTRQRQIWMLTRKLIIRRNQKVSSTVYGTRNGNKDVVCGTREAVLKKSVKKKVIVELVYGPDEVMLQRSKIPKWIESFLTNDVQARNEVLSKKNKIVVKQLAEKCQKCQKYQKEVSKPNRGSINVFSFRDICLLLARQSTEKELPIF